MADATIIMIDDTTTTILILAALFIVTSSVHRYSPLGFALHRTGKAARRQGKNLAAPRHANGRRSPATVSLETAMTALMRAAAPRRASLPYRQAESFARRYRCHRSRGCRLYPASA